LLEEKESTQKDAVWEETLMPITEKKVISALCKMKRGDREKNRDNVEKAAYSGGGKKGGVGGIS